MLNSLQASGQHGLQPKPADIGQYLHPTGILETRYTRLMASLCSHTYYMEKLTVRCHAMVGCHQPGQLQLGT